LSSRKTCHSLFTSGPAKGSRAGKGGKDRRPGSRKQNKNQDLIGASLSGVRLEPDMPVGDKEKAGSTRDRCRSPREGGIIFLAAAVGEIMPQCSVILCWFFRVSLP